MAMTPKQSRARQRYNARHNEKKYASNFVEKKGEHTLTQLTKRITDNGVTSQQINKLYHQYRPTISKLLSRLRDNDADRQSDLQQYALITLWSVIYQHGVDVHPSIVINALKCNLTNAYLEDMRLYHKSTNVQTHRKYRDAIKDYIAKHGEKPTSERLADFMGIRVGFVRHVLLKSAVKFKSIEDHERGNTRSNHKYGAVLYARKNDYEDRLIYWIDKHWIDGVIKRLDPISASGLNCIMSEGTDKEWGQQNGINHTTVINRKKKGLSWAKALADTGFKVDEPRGPRQYLLDHGFDVSYRAYKKVKLTV